MCIYWGIYWYIWVYIGIYVYIWGYIWVYMGIQEGKYGYIWVHMDIQGYILVYKTYASVYMGIYRHESALAGYIWLCIGIFGGV